jgi:hypothetical protein
MDSNNNSAAPIISKGKSDLTKMDCPINIALRNIKSRICYFNENKIWCSMSIEDAEHYLKGISKYEKNNQLYMSTSLREYFNVSNIVYILITISKMSEGDSWSKFIEIYNQVEYKQREKPKNLNRFITKINRPVFERFPENTNQKTFDMIRIDVNIITNHIPEIMGNLSFSQYIKSHSKEIKKLVLCKIEKSIQFHTYGIPITFLKLESAIYHRNLSLIEFIFTLKEIPDK